MEQKICGCLQILFFLICSLITCTRAITNVALSFGNDKLLIFFHVTRGVLQDELHCKCDCIIELLITSIYLCSHFSHDTSWELFTLTMFMPIGLMQFTFSVYIFSVHIKRLMLHILFYSWYFTHFQFSVIFLCAFDLGFQVLLSQKILSLVPQISSMTM